MWFLFSWKEEEQKTKEKWKTEKEQKINIERKLINQLIFQDNDFVQSFFYILKSVSNDCWVWSHLDWNKTAAIAASDSNSVDRP